MMIVLSTDFGIEGPYIGQVKAALYQQAPDCKVIDLFSDLPPYQPQASAALIAAYSRGFPAGTVFLCVIDPGVGMPQRRGIVLKSNDCWFVGPDNGLFDLVMKHDKQSQCWTITWRPVSLSNSFHGRDLFAPIAAELASDSFPAEKLLLSEKRSELAAITGDYPYVAYIDRFGNIITGLRAASLSTEAVIMLAGHNISYARTFGEVEAGALFWYKNSNGLVEIAISCGAADQVLNVSVGNKVYY